MPNTTTDRYRIVTIMFVGKTAGRGALQDMARTWFKNRRPTQSARSTEAISDLVGTAQTEAKHYLAEEHPDRWHHTIMVAAETGHLAQTLTPGVADIITAAAWLHDIGYAKPLARTKFHPLDGANAIRDSGLFPDSVAQLVAYHSGAVYEAHERGLTDELSAFTLPPREWLNILTSADLATGPTGLPVTPEDRLDEVQQRYSQTDPVHRAITVSRPYLLADVADVRERAREHIGRRWATIINAFREDQSASVAQIRTWAATYGWRLQHEDFDGAIVFVSHLAAMHILFTVEDYTVRQAVVRPYSPELTAQIVDRFFVDPLPIIGQWFAAFGTPAPTPADTDQPLSEGTSSK